MLMLSIKNCDIIINNTKNAHYYYYMAKFAGDVIIQVEQSTSRSSTFGEKMCIFQEN